MTSRAPHTLTRQGRRIAFTESGSGGCLVMTHSFLCSRKMWQTQAEDLARDHRVVNVDLRGHGESELGGNRFSLEDLADDVVAVLDAVGVKKAVWVGLSIGGMLSLRAALKHPERVAALVLADTDAHRDPWKTRARYRLMVAAARTFGIAPLLPAVSKLMFGVTSLRNRPQLVSAWQEEFRGVSMPTIAAGVAALGRRRSLLDRLGEITVPALVIVGAEDLAQPPWRSRRLADALPGGELHVIPGAGHLSAIEQPEEVTRAIRRFLAAIPG